MHGAVERRHIGPVTAMLMLIGLVIGVSIFILPGQLGATAGPGVLLAYVIAGAVALVGCLVAAQVGAVLPVSGASFVLLSQCLSPFVAFVAVWLILGAGCMAVALLAYGFADYLALLVPGLPAQGVALAVVATVGVLNAIGARTALLSQNVFVVLMMLALFGFCAVGSTHIARDNLEPWLPVGLGPVISAAVPAFFSFSGFLLIMEVGGEVKNPGRSIPFALLGAFVVVLVTYLAVALVVVGVQHWSTLADLAAPVGEQARRFLPGWGSIAIALTALLATITSLNAIVLSYARDLLALARAQLLPARFARLNHRGEPHWSVAMMTLLSLAAVLAGATLVQYATAVSVAAMVLQMLFAVAAWRLSGRLPEEFRLAEFKLPPWLWRGAIGALFVSSACFAYVGARDTPELLGVLAVYTVVGALYYAVRRH